MILVDDDIPSGIDPAEAPQSVRLLPNFSCSVGQERIAISPLHERVLSRLAVAHPTWVSRDTVIDDCELHDVGDPRARLRQICWTLRSRAGLSLIAGDRQRLGIVGSCSIDFFLASKLCQWLLARQFDKEAVNAVPSWFIHLLGEPLLHDWGWDDSWLQPVQARWDVLRLGVMERLSRSLLDTQRLDLALVCAHGLIQEDPLRENAWEVMIEALMLSGRRAEARAHFERLSEMLDDQLGLKPSVSTHQLVRHLFR